MKLVIPAISQHRIERCLASLKIDPADIILVDNSEDGLVLPYPVGMYIHNGTNLGVARAWNIGVREIQQTRDDYLVICSQSVVFGDAGGLDLLDTLTDPIGVEYVGFGWHLNAFSREFFEEFGYFDEHFYPAYFEDTDALYRMGLMGMPSPRENGRSRPYHAIDGHCTIDAGALRDGVRVDFGPITDYYYAKWGGHQGYETFRYPFNMRDKHVGWWEGCENAGAIP